MAKSWVLKSRLGCNQRDEETWKGIKEYFLDTKGMDRTVEARRCKWRSVSKNCQRWLASRKLVATKIPSCWLLEYEEDRIMLIYCKRAGKRDSTADLSEAPKFYMQDTAAFLSTQPKWMAFSKSTCLGNTQNTMATPQ